jgi:hypothetical protein
VFSNSGNSHIQKWATYLAGDVKRQAFLETALDWVSNGAIYNYMSKHRYDENIDQLKSYFDEVIDWVSSAFTGIETEMRGLEWGRLYKTYHTHAYDPEQVWAQVRKLYGDEHVKNRRGVFEYILSGGVDKGLLEIRFFEESVKHAAYERQTSAAEEKGISNCSVCAHVENANQSKIWQFSEMDADHVSAWSRGGATTAENCEMLCKPHNRAKGNR